MGRWQDMCDRVASIVVDTFTTTATYRPASGSSYSLDGVFDAAHTEISILDGAEIQSVFPAFFTRLGAMEAAPAVGDRITVNGTLYRVAESRPDGEAGALLVLNKL